MNRRTPTSRSTIDHGPLTLSLGSAYFCDGSHRPFEVVLYRRVTLPGQGGVKADGSRYDARRVDSYTLRVPTLSFARAYRLRRFGALRVFGLQARLLNWFR